MEQADSSKSHGQGEYQDEKRGFLPLFLIAQVIAGISIVIVVTWLQNMGGLDWRFIEHRFNWHPFLMIVSLVFLYGNAMMIYRLMKNEPKFRVKMIHMTLNGLALITAVIGIMATFTVHDDHMFTLHAWIGMGTVVLFAVNLIGGFAFFLLPQIRAEVRTAFLPLHVYGGKVALVLIGFSIVSGTMETATSALSGGKYAKLPLEAYLLNFLGICAILFILVVGYVVSYEGYKRKSDAAEIDSAIIAG
jgi:cytochrome b-561